jgi:hypothetical protein
MAKETFLIAKGNISSSRHVGVYKYPNNIYLHYSMVQFFHINLSRYETSGLRPNDTITVCTTSSRSCAVVVVVVGDKQLSSPRVQESR